MASIIGAVDFGSFIWLFSYLTCITIMIIFIKKNNWKFDYIGSRLYRRLFEVCLRFRAQLGELYAFYYVSTSQMCIFTRNKKSAAARTLQLLLEILSCSRKKILLYCSCFLSSLHTGSKPSTPIDSKIGQLPQRPEWYKRTKSRLDPCRFRRVMIRTSLP